MGKTAGIRTEAGRSGRRCSPCRRSKPFRCRSGRAVRSPRNGSGRRRAEDLRRHLESAATTSRRCRRPGTWSATRLCRSRSASIRRRRNGHARPRRRFRSVGARPRGRRRNRPRSRRAWRSRWPRVAGRGRRTESRSSSSACSSETHPIGSARPRRCARARAPGGRSAFVGGSTTGTLRPGRPPPQSRPPRPPDHPPGAHRAKARGPVPM